MSARFNPRLAAAAAAFGLTLAGCDTLNQVGELGAAVGVATGSITEEQGQSLTRTTQAFGSALEKLTPENEYYVGRAVMANVFQKYKPYDAATVTDYLNHLGQALALASDRPETFGGYHFLALDSAEINAFAAPGGLIVVTRGMLRCCKNEDEVAAVLAHEIGHVQWQHGLRAIKTSRWTGAWTTLALESGKSLGKQDLAEATTALESSVGDISQTLMNSGYGRSAERQADAAAVQILTRLGYDPNALVAMLTQMKKNMKPGGLGFAKTHPDPMDRVAELRKTTPLPAPFMPPAVRQQRFQRMLSGI